MLNYKIPPSEKHLPWNPEILQIRWILTILVLLSSFRIPTYPGNLKLSTDWSALGFQTADPWAVTLSSFVFGFESFGRSLPNFGIDYMMAHIPNSISIKPLNIYQIFCWMKLFNSQVMYSYLWLMNCEVPGMKYHCRVLRYSLIASYRHCEIP